MPSVNDNHFVQSAALLRDIAAQATGTAVQTPLNTSEFVSVAQTALKVGYDPVLNAISQVVGRTIFSQRPYKALLSGMEWTESQFGAVTRKISIADKSPRDDDSYKWPVGYDASQSPADGNGQAVDHYELMKPEFLQTNFYGSLLWEDGVTIFRNQLDTAFKSPDELSQFFAMIGSNIDSKHEQYKEHFKRMCLCNFIAGVLDEGNNSRVVHLLSEYKSLIGDNSLTAQTIWNPTNFKPFMQWVYSRVAQISAMMRERSQMYQTVINSKPVMRHTPYEAQRLYLFGGTRYAMEAMVLADTYHDNYLKMADTETLSYWQSIESPDSIAITPVYTATDGTVKVASAQVEQAGVFGVLSDREAFGVAEIDKWSSATPLNARGGYSNLYWHSRLRAVNDNTEKGVVLLLD